MTDFKKLALEISDQFPFKAFAITASAITNGEADQGNLSPCENHLDKDFMKLLDQGAHLDVSIMPL